ncbi:MAG: glycoside hydrolase family 20 zincin-like fold domain-containing protein [Chitinophagaceae bacterium]
MKKYTTNTIWIYLVMMLISGQAFSQVNIIPKPVSLTIGDGIFTLNSDTKIVFKEKDLGKQAAFFNDYLQKFYGFKLKTTRKNKSGPNIVLTNASKLE